MVVTGGFMYCVDSSGTCTVLWTKSINGGRVLVTVTVLVLCGTVLIDVVELEELLDLLERVDVAKVEGVDLVEDAVDVDEL